MSLRTALASSAVVASLAILPLVTAGTAEAVQCKVVFTQAEAVGPNAATAAASARSFWSTKVKNKYHLAWSVWDIAAAKSQNCGWTGNQQYCIVKARPCLYLIP